MVWLVTAVLAVHGLVHLMGVAKAFGYADLPSVTQPIARDWGTMWLLAALAVLASAVALGSGSRRFWIIGLAGAVLSQTVIVAAWRDAWAGTLANVVLLIAVAYGWQVEGPRSFHAAFLRDAQTGLARSAQAPVVTDRDLGHLPSSVQRHLRLAGVVGEPRVQNYRVRFRGRIRSGPESAWMRFTAEQYSFTDQPARLFLMRARMFGLPVEAWHRLTGGHATMRVRIAGAVTLVNASGDVMDRSESVTLFNDMCLLAPGTLIDPSIRWESIDERSARAWFTHGAHTIEATLVFGDDGRLADFVSDDRSRSSADGTHFTQLRFSTPVRDYRSYGPVSLAAHGEARWHLPEGPFTYGEFEILDVAFNVRPQGDITREVMR